MGDITDLTVCELIEKLDKKELTSEEIVKAYSDRIKEKENDVQAFITNTCESLKVKLEEGAYDNIKITTPEDILLAEQILETLEEE